METKADRPRLVFFQYRYDDQFPPFLKLHKQAHVRCLSEFFDVQVVNWDCDYQVICDTYEPDLVLFEGDVPCRGCHRIQVSNTKVNASVPKVGLHNADAFDGVRAGFLSDMEHWGVGTIFAIATTAPEHTPAIADALFVWPNFIDPGICRDYRQAKQIPVLFTGNRNRLYPWRNKIISKVCDAYPTLICPHPGYLSKARVADVLFGERYARLLSAAQVAPCCGSVANEVVRKHFEIPGCNTCLVTERTSGLEAAGFVDMENCVFADEDDVLDKLAYLFSNPSELERITRAGHDLVHQRHTFRNRSQILQWFRLSRNLEGNQRIVQPSPFSDLRIEDGAAHSFVRGNGRHLVLLREGDALLQAGHYHDAASRFRRCSSYIEWMPEPIFKLALCELHLGQAESALRRLHQTIEPILVTYGARDPDPIEWAYLILAEVCCDKTGDAMRHAKEFPWLEHPILQSVRRLVFGTLPSDPPLGYSTETVSRIRPSLHVLPALSRISWEEDTAAILHACGNTALAQAVLRGQPLITPTPTLSRTPERVRSSAETFRRRASYRRRAEALRHGAAVLLHALERHWRYFLPYPVSEARRNSFFVGVESALQDSAVRTVLLLGAQCGEVLTEAVLAGCRARESELRVVCCHTESRAFRQLQSAAAGKAMLRFVLLPSTDGARQGLPDLLYTSASPFDMVVLSTRELPLLPSTLESLLAAGPAPHVVVMDGALASPAFDSFQRLLKTPAYRLAAYDEKTSDGCALFRKHFDAGCAPQAATPFQTHHCQSSG